MPPQLPKNTQITLKRSDEVITISSMSVLLNWTMTLAPGSLQAFTVIPIQPFFSKRLHLVNMKLLRRAI
jgi:hypothetical protein